MKILTLADVCTKEVVTVMADTLLVDTLIKMQKKHISAVVVCEKQKPVGIFTERDAVLISAKRYDVNNTPVSEFMNTPLVTADSRADFQESYQKMSLKGLRHLVVVDAEGKLSGILSEADFLNHIGMEFLVEFKTVASSMCRRIFTIGVDEKLGDAIDLMAAQRISCTIVEDKTEIVGIVTERDVVRFMGNQENLDDIPITQVMSHPPVMIQENATLQEAMQQMELQKIRRLIVTDKQRRTQGLITRHDIVKSLEGNYIAFLHETISQQRRELESVRNRLSAAQEYTLLLDIVDHAHDAIAIADAETGELLEVNREACQQLGYGKSELIQLKVFEYADFAKDLDAWLQMFASLESKTSVLLESEYVCKDGSRLPVEVSIRYLTDIDRALVIFIARDITERKHSELEHKRLSKQLLQAQKMEAIGQLTGGIAHDFNNILAAILGYNSLASSRYAHVCPPKLMEYLNQVKLAGERGRDLVSQMLLFSRGGETEPKAFLLPPLIKEGIKMMRSSLPTSICINTYIDQALPAVMMDPVQLQQILMNLFINARDAISGNGTIEVELAWQKDLLEECSSCHQQLSGDWIVLTISDTGSGISADNLEQIFAPFFTTKEMGKGTGMGLAVVHGIVHKHNAHLVVNSVLGSGTTFKVLFPAVEQSVYSSSPEKKSTQLIGTCSPGNILLVDDEISVADFMYEVLSNQGFQVQTFHNPQTALTRFKLSPQDFDLIITDQTMPEMTGIELVKNCKALKADIPIIMCSGHSEDVDEKKATARGVNQFFYKPLDINQLLKAVDDLIVCRASK